MRTNCNSKTGIPFGIVSQNNIDCEILEEFSSSTEYCPNCASEMPHDREHELVCPICDHIFQHGDQYPEDVPQYYEKNGIQAIWQNGDVWFLESPYLWEGNWASPCAPGAVTIPGAAGVQAYGPPPDWMEEGVVGIFTTMEA